MATVNPYLTFDGTCEAAFNHYKTVIGGDFVNISRFKDMPGPHRKDASDDNLIMHVALPVGKTSILMGSDRPPSYGAGKVGDNFSVSLTADSREHADKLFKGLAEGGQVTMPMGDAPWGAYFGMLTDKYDIQWMISFDEKFA